MQKVFNLNQTLAEEVRKHNDNDTYDLVQGMDAISLEPQTQQRCWFTDVIDNGSISIPVLSYLLDELFTRDSILQVLDGPPKAKHQYKTLKISNATKIPNEA